MTVKTWIKTKKIFQWYKMDFNHPTFNPQKSSGIFWYLFMMLFSIISKNITFLDFLWRILWLNSNKFKHTMIHWFAGCRCQKYVRKALLCTLFQDKQRHEVEKLNSICIILEKSYYEKYDVLDRRRTVMDIMIKLKNSLPH